MRKFIIVTAMAMAFAGGVNAGEPNVGSPIITVFNNSFDTITSIKTTSAGGIETVTNETVDGGGSEVAVRMANNTVGRAGCLFSINLTFDGKPAITVKDFDACKSNRLVVRDVVRAARRQAVAIN